MQNNLNNLIQFSVAMSLNHARSVVHVRRVAIA